MHSCRDGDGKTFVSGQIERGPAAVHFQSLAKEKREREMFVGWLLSDMCEKTADGHAGRQELARRHRAARVGQHRLSQVITNQIVLLDSF